MQDCLTNTSLSVGKNKKLAWIKYLLLGAFLLGLAGSNLPIYGKLRPFHFGAVLGLCGIALLWPQIHYKKNYSLEAIALFSLALLQLLWVPYLDRYLIYLIFITLGIIYFSIGKAIVLLPESIHKKYIWLVLFFWTVASLIRVFIIRDFPDPIGGALGNMNNMAAALVLLLLIHYLLFNSPSYILYSAGWLFSVSLSRRATMVALVCFAVLDTILDRSNFKNRIKKITIYLAITGIGFAFRWGHLRSTSLMNYFTNNTSSFENGSSDNVRITLLAQMWEQIKHAPPLQLLMGQGLGQLNLHVQSWNASWASPHLFWLEMYFYFGAAWLIWLLWLFYKSDAKGKTTLITLAFVGIAMSSMIYFMPFYLLMGILVGRYNILQGRIKLNQLE